MDKRGLYALLLYFLSLTAIFSHPQTSEKIVCNIILIPAQYNACQVSSSYGTYILKIIFHTVFQIFEALKN